MDVPKITCTVDYEHIAIINGTVITGKAEIWERQAFEGEWDLCYCTS